MRDRRARTTRGVAVRGVRARRRSFGSSGVESFGGEGIRGEAELIDKVLKSGVVQRDGEDIDAGGGALWKPITFPFYEGTKGVARLLAHATGGGCVAGTRRCSPVPGEAWTEATKDRRRSAAGGVGLGTCHGWWR